MKNTKSKYVKCSQIPYSNPWFHVLFWFFSNSDPYRWTATFGVSTAFPKEIRRVNTILIHNNYNSGTHENDIAVVKLSRPIAFNKNIHIVCLPEATQNISPGSTAYVTGWGSQISGGKHLRKNETKTTTKSLVLAIK